VKLHVIYGHRYQGAAKIPWAAEWFVTHDRALRGLAQKGFRDSAVWDSADTLPSNWPADHRTGDIFARATWGGATGDIDLPSEVIWVADMGAVPMPNAATATAMSVQDEVSNAKDAASQRAARSAEKRSNIAQNVMIASGVVSIVVALVALLKRPKVAD
jgi:hypothetical protein